MRILHGKAAELLKSGLAPDRARFKVYESRDRLSLGLPNLKVEEMLWLAVEECGLL